MGGSVPELPGVKAEPELARQFRKEVADLLGRRTLGFPGAQPVSFALKHIQALQSEDFYVCEKTDGIRCLMYFAADEAGQEIHYLIDRRNDYYYVPELHFPVPNDETFQNFHVDTIIDGELVNDRMPDGELQLKYLVFDCLILDGNSLMQRTLDKRLAYFREKVHKPYKELYKRYPQELQYLPFIVEFKDMEFSYGIEKMFREILPNLPHGNDGLIFTARNRPYEFGTDEYIVKWKPETENSVDFRLSLDFPLREPDSEEEAEGETEPRPDWDAMPTFRLSVSHGQEGYRDYADMHMTADEWEHMKGMGRPLQDTIVECVQDEQGRWRFARFRDDKDDANHIRTVESVIESIQDRVSQADLMAAAKSIRDQWKRRQREEAEQRQRGAGGHPHPHPHPHPHQQQQRQQQQQQYPQRPRKDHEDETQRRKAIEDEKHRRIEAEESRRRLRDEERVRRETPEAGSDGHVDIKGDVPGDVSGDVPRDVSNGVRTSDATNGDGEHRHLSNGLGPSEAAEASTEDERARDRDRDRDRNHVPALLSPSSPSTEVTPGKTKAEEEEGVVSVDSPSPSPPPPASSASHLGLETIRPERERSKSPMKRKADALEEA